jgi:hypothetical protein
MPFLVPNVSVFNFLPTFTKPETCTFLTNTAINSFSKKQLSYKGISSKQSQFKMVINANKREMLVEEEGVEVLT